MFIVFCGAPGSGKSTLINKYLENHAATVFHVPDILKENGKYRHLLSEKERIFIDDNWGDVTKSFRNGDIACFSSGNMSLIQIVLRVIDVLEQHGTVLLDAFPRDVEQAEAFIRFAKNRNVFVYNIVRREDEYEFSVVRQALREFSKGQDYSRLHKFAKKTKTYFEKTKPCIELLKDVFPYSNCFVEENGNVLTPMYHRFNHISNGQDLRFANEFYFYPVGVETYREFFRDYHFGKYPVMATVTLGNYCGDNCVGCFNAYMNDGAEISKETLLRFLDDFGKNGGKAVKAAGREPTLYPYLKEFLFGCLNNNIYSCIITGGAMLSKHSGLFAQYCDELRVSLNALNPDTHVRIHCPADSSDDFVSRENALRHILAERNARGLTTGITFLDREENKGELLGFVEKWRDADYIRLASLNYFGGKPLSEELQSAEKIGDNVRIHKVFEEDDIRVPDHFVCPALLSRVLVLANGDVVACHKYAELEKEGIPANYGNLNTSSFSEIWNSEKRKETVAAVCRQNMDNFVSYGKYECGVCEGCKYTNFNQINRWLALHRTEKIFCLD